MSVTTLSADQVIKSFQWRYAVKRFDPSRKIEPRVWDAIEKCLVLTPSSFGLQPWKALVISSETMKSKLTPISWNQSQPSDCSHMVIFAAMKSVSLDYVDQFLSKIVSVRGVPMESLAPYRQMMAGFLENAKEKHLAWSSNQAYIALGQLMAVAATMGVDACPMEGIATAEYDRLLGLEGSNHASVVGCALGFRHADDKYSTLPKVRFDAEDIVVHF